jgi:hypothetical protein
VRACARAPPPQASLVERLKQLVPVKQAEFKELSDKFGNKSLGEVTVSQVRAVAPRRHAPSPPPLFPVSHRRALPSAIRPSPAALSSRPPFPRACHRRWAARAT